MSTKNIRTEKIFKKKILFLKSKYYIQRVISHQIDITLMILTLNLTSIQLTIISCWIINNLFIKNKINCMFLKIIYAKMMCINYTKYIIRKISEN